jgi:hypothetical protein
MTVPIVRAARHQQVLVLVLAVFLAVLTFGLDPVLWPTPAGVMTPPQPYLGVLMLVAGVESLAFGAGVAFAIAGYRWAIQAPGSRRLRVAAYVSVVWTLVSWWPHDSFHRVTAHDNWAGLVRIELGFHLTLVAAAVIIAGYFLSIARES